MPRFAVRLTKTVVVTTEVDADDDRAAAKLAKERYPGCSSCEVRRKAEQRPAGQPVRRYLGCEA